MRGTITANGSFTIGSFPIGESAMMPKSFYAAGTFGGGTLKVQVTPDGAVANATDVSGASLTAAGNKLLPVVNGGLVLVLSGATNPSITWWVQ